VKMMSLDLTGPSAICRYQLEDANVEGGILPGSLYLETPSLERISLHPLLWHRSTGVFDRVLFLNRAREGSRGIVFLCYETGELQGLNTAEADGVLARDVAQVLDWSRSDGSVPSRWDTSRLWARNRFSAQISELPGRLPGDGNEPDALDAKVIRLPEAGEAAFRNRPLRPARPVS
jgi:hypothetical protein